MALAEVVQLVERVAPVALAHERSLPVLPALESLLPSGIRRGATVTVDGGPGATALALALAAGASQAGSWTAVVGAGRHGPVGSLAAHELGVALERLLVVPDPPNDQRATVVAALLDAVDVILVGGRPCNAGDTRRLAARARERGAVIVSLPGSGGPGADVQLSVSSSASSWSCNGRLLARRVTVVAGGRGTAAPRRRAELWLPDADGAVSPA